MSIGAVQDGAYQVVARRYRPQNFTELVGQKHVAQALSRAIETNRVGHAYLFTGARGVGKTSTARIFAKALNCQTGPTTAPCGECDSCRGIASGEDVDVLEIDGASNRGIDEIRQLRSNINIRPSRSRYKIYIIDEVHMLTTQAFNALLKTLEEPPKHVKFFFCTTEAEKIPITVLSRCQRYDFTPIESQEIVARLRAIVATEKASADEEALQLLARRAAGSLRDSQSLLEQLLSMGGRKITTGLIYEMLGAANRERLRSLAASVVAKDSAGALREIERALSEGVDPGQLAEQLLGHFRDITAVAVGADANQLLHLPATEFDEAVATGKAIGAETLLAMLQVIDQSLVRMRQSVQTRTLLEICVIRLCRLENLESIANLAYQISQGANPTAGSAASGPRPVTRVAYAPTSKPGAPEPVVSDEKIPLQEAKKPLEQVPARSPSFPVIENVPSPPIESRSADFIEPPQIERMEVAAYSPLKLGEISPPKLGEISHERAQATWQEAIGRLRERDTFLADWGENGSVSEVRSDGRFVITFPANRASQKAQCEKPQQKASFESALAEVLGVKPEIEFALSAEKTPETKKSGAPPRQTMASNFARERELERHPFVARAIELFGADIQRVQAPPKPKEED